MLWNFKYPEADNRQTLRRKGHSNCYRNGMLTHTIHETEWRCAYYTFSLGIVCTQAKQLEKRVDDMEQYQRRLCLRINGIPCSNDESAEDCLRKVKSLVKNDLKVDVPDLAFDRAHRIGKVSQEAEN